MPTTRASASKSLAGGGTEGKPKAFSARIRDELVRLRRDHGVTEQRFKSAQSILSLPAVAAEAVSRGFGVGDEHLAAYNVVRCALEHPRWTGGRVQHRKILIVTLNYAHRQGLLDQRRNDLQVELGIGRNTFSRWEQAGYEMLADQLVGLRTSPCQEDLSTPAVALFGLGEHWDLDSLKRLISFFAVENSERYDQLIRRVLIETFVSIARPNTPQIDALGRLNSEFFLQVGDSALVNYRLHRDLLIYAQMRGARQNGPALLSAESVAALILRENFPSKDYLAAEMTQGNNGKLLRSAIHDPWAVTPRGSLTRLYFSAKAASIEVFAHYFQFQMRKLTAAYIEVAEDEVRQVNRAEDLHRSIVQSIADRESLMTTEPESSAFKIAQSRDADKKV